MTGEEWVFCTDPAVMLEYFREKATERKVRLLGCGLCETYRREFTDARSWSAVEMGYRVADGLAVVAEQKRAFESARKVAEQLEEYRVFSSPHLIPAYAAGDSQHVREIPIRVLTAFDCNFYVNPRRAMCSLLRCLHGNPLRPAILDHAWLTSTVRALAARMYENHDFSAMPILADALQDAGCENEDILNHCRQPGEHVRGCWVVNLLTDRA